MRRLTVPARITEPRAYEVACALLEGFDRHYRLFRQLSAGAKLRFEAGDWHGQQAAQRERIEYYDQRVREAAERLRGEFAVDQLSMAAWQQVKLLYIGLLVEHHQPELAETFFNSVTVKLLHRTYFRNDFIFVWPAVSTEYIEDHDPTITPAYRAYYPTRATLRATLHRLIEDFGLRRPFEDLDRDLADVLAALEQRDGQPLARWTLRPNFQIQMLASLFFRNKGAYAVGKIVNGYAQTSFALPILHTDAGALAIDTVMLGEDELLLLFSFARAYFMVDMDVPSAYVQFLRSLMPRKARSELYSALGLHKQGKNLFYRDFLHHLRHSSDRFRVAPGVKGMVMLVFDLPSYPYVFKVIRDVFPPQKDVTRAEVQAKYRLVKRHDRVGRMADTLEYSDVAFPRARFAPELLAELQRDCPSLLEDDGDALVIRHVYIERRMIPLNLYLREATPAQLERAVIEYGNAIRDLVAANIFPGDLLWKNFGVTRHGKVVFYDYDEIEYLTDCSFRRVPAPPTDEDELGGEPWYPVGPRDVYPETFGPFLLGDARVRAVFLAHHAELLDPGFWQQHKQRILAGHVHDVFPYDPRRRFASRRALAA